MSARKTKSLAITVAQAKNWQFWHHNSRSLIADFRDKLSGQITILRYYSTHLYKSVCQAGIYPTTVDISTPIKPHSSLNKSLRIQMRSIICQWFGRGLVVFMWRHNATGDVVQQNWSVEFQDVNIGCLSLWSWPWRRMQKLTAPWTNRSMMQDAHLLARSTSVKETKS